jgi:hemin uptake protein HemP
MTKTDNNARDLLRAPATEPVTLPLPTERVLPLQEILGDAREVVLLHAGQRYRLRLTSNDRLILTK